VRQVFGLTYSSSRSTYSRDDLVKLIVQGSHRAPRSSYHGRVSFNQVKWRHKSYSFSSNKRPDSFFSPRYKSDVLQLNVQRHSVRIQVFQTTTTRRVSYLCICLFIKADGCELEACGLILSTVQYLKWIQSTSVNPVSQDPFYYLLPIYACLQNGIFPQLFSTTILLSISHFLHARFMPCPIHSPWLDHPINI
jgi:hypothetical protein